MRPFDLPTAVGQCIVLGVSGTSLSDEHVRLLRDVRPGGVILLGRNGDDPRGVHALAHDLRDAAARAGSAPLWLATDGEPGFVFPFKAGLPVPPSPWSLGRVDDDLALSAFRLLARLVVAMGFDLNFYPLADVNTEPDNPVIGLRAFGDEPGIVSLRVAQAVSASLDAGLIPCVKHYPGHGDAVVDSHLALPSVARDERAWSVALEPFDGAFKSGCPSAMVAHVLCPDVDDKPATLSARHVHALRELARRAGVDDLLVVTDSLSMAAVSDGRAVSETVIASLVGGCDVVLSCDVEVDWPRVLQDVCRAVSSGRLDEARVYDAASRILRMKRRHRSAGRLSGEELSHAQTIGADFDLVERIADAAASVSIAEPFGCREAVTCCVGRTDSRHSDPYGAFVGELAHHVSVRDCCALTSDPPPGLPVLATTTSRGPLGEDDQALVSRLAQTCPQFGLVQLWSPFHACRTPHLLRAAASFCPTEVAVRALARKIARRWF